MKYEVNFNLVANTGNTKLELKMIEWIEIKADLIQLCCHEVKHNSWEVIHDILMSYFKRIIWPLVAWCVSNLQT